jgi:twitching motility protein PilT
MDKPIYSLDDTETLPKTGLKSLENVHVDEFLQLMMEKNASDLHICAYSEPILRVDGKLERLSYEKFTPEQSKKILYEILTDAQIQRYETTYELDFAYAWPDKARFRVNIYRERGAVAAAFRLISNRVPTLRELNMPTVLEQIAEKPRGLVLVTGPTGSGKSTTLAAMINHINETKADHIITIEDPIEYLHTHKKSLVNQRELGSDTKSFANALRASLREDPDVILVGEMRDPETIHLAITAAETGHLVFATLHTNTAAESIDRIIDVFEPAQQSQIRVQLANNIQAGISQQLLPRAAGSGRVPALEIMIATPAVRNLIRENKTFQITSIIQTSGSTGMITMDQYLKELCTKGVISVETGVSRSVNPEELKKMIGVPPVGAPGPMRR